MSKNEERDRSRECKKRRNRRYGQAKLKHAKKGILSCIVAGMVLVLFAILLVIAYTSAGTAAGYVGGLGVLAMLFSFIGLHLARKGLKEREKDYLTCKIGGAFNFLFFFVFIAIFCWGMF